MSGPSVTAIRAGVPRVRTLGLAALLIALGAAALAIAVRLAEARGDRARSELVQAAGPRRFCEARVTGGFRYGPLQPVKRAATIAAGSERWELFAAAARIKDDASAATPTAEDLSNLGVAQLLLGNPDEAVALLEEAILREPRNARFLTDLSAAYLERAKARGEPEDVARALDAAERGRAEEPRSLEALYDRALALEKLSFSREAREAWVEYVVAAGPRDAWATEVAATRLAPMVPREDEWRRDKEQLLVAATRGERTIVAEIVHHYPQETRETMEQEWLAMLPLPSAKLVAEALASHGGDGLLADSVTRLEALEPEGREALLALHRGYREAKRSYDVFDFSTARPLFEGIERGMRLQRSPFALWAGLHLAICDYYRGDPAEAERRFDALLSEPALDDSPSLKGRLLWHKGLLASLRGSYASAGTFYATALACFERLREQEHVAALHSLLAYNLDALGDARAAWNHRFEALSRNAFLLDRRRRFTILQSAALSFLQGGLLHAAGAVQASIVRDVEADPAYGPEQRCEALRFQGLIQGRLGDAVKARATFARARSALASFRDLRLAQRLAAEVDYRRGEAVTPLAPREALVSIGRTIEYFQRLGFTGRLPSVYLARGRAHAAAGDRRRAEEDYTAGVELLESLRDERLREALRISLLDRTWELYAELIRQRLDDGDAAAAFSWSERGRAMELRHATAGAEDPRRWSTLEELRQALPVGVRLICYELLEDRLAVWTVSADGDSSLQLRLDVEGLRRRVLRFLTALARDAASEDLEGQAEELHRELITPLAPYLRPNETLVIVTDDVLHALPFGCLVDPVTKRHLLERHALLKTPSVTHYARTASSAPSYAAGERGALVVAPEAGAGFEALPAAREEARDVAGLYPGALLLSGVEATRSRFLAALPGKRILHFAGHAVGGRAQEGWLVFAPSPGDDGVLTGAAIPLDALKELELVILSACRTGEGPVARGEGSLSLARPFLAAGVPSVVGTLWEVDDLASRRLATGLHRRLLLGKSAVQALREAQLELLRGPEVSLRTMSRWGAFEILGGSTGRP